MKKGLTIFIGILLIVLVVGYITGRSDQPQQVRILKLAHSLNTQHPVHVTMEYMADKVKELSEGRMEVQIFPSEQLGNEKECIEALQLGYLAITKTSSGPMEAFIPRIRIFGIPYLFRDSEHFWKVALGPIGKELLEEGAPLGLKGLCYYDAGARSFYAKKPIRSPEDLKGLKVRVMNSVMCMQMVEAMGGSPTPMSWGELYTSLDQGVVDAAENNPPSFETSMHFEVCPYYSLDEHLRLPDMLIISTRVWEGLSKEEQDILQQAVDASVIEGRRLWAEAEERSLAKVKAAGVEVSYPDKKPFQEAVLTMWRRYLEADPNSPNEEERKDAAIGKLIKRIQEVQ